MERTLEELEKQSWDKINVALKNNEAQEEQDDSVICDVCRSVSSFFLNYYVSVNTTIYTNRDDYF
jgi:hypothetical protein